MGRKTKKVGESNPNANKTQDKVQKATIKEVAKRFEEYETANKELKEQNEYMKRKLYGKFTYDIKQFVKKHKNKKDLN